MPAAVACGVMVGDSERLAIAGVALPRLGEPEIEDLDDPVVGELDVGRFEIAVDDARFVGRLERLGDLSRDRDRFVDRDRAAWMRSERSSPSTNSMTRNVVVPALAFDGDSESAACTRDACATTASGDPWLPCGAAVPAAI